jgi:hypothetical protein
MLGGILLWRSLPRASRTATLGSTVPSESSRAVTKKLFTTPRERLSPTEAVPLECERYFNEIRALDLSDLLTSPENPRIQNLGESCPSVPKMLALSEARFRQECQNLPTEIGAPACYAALLSFRAALTDWLTRNTPLTEIRDSRVLTDKLLHRFVTDPGEATEIADRLLEVEPRSIPAAKASLLGHFLRAKTAAPNNSGVWDEVDKRLEKVKSISPPDDKELVQLETVIDSIRNKDLARTLELAEDLDRVHPNWGIGPYQKAWVKHKEGHRQQAIQLVEEAYRREPHEARFKRTLDRLKYAHNLSDLQPFETVVRLKFEDYH